jgi:vesicular inhibitory amino acid transporter
MGIINDEIEQIPDITTTSHAKLSLIAAAIFIAGEVAGSGVLALPYAINEAGWAGIGLVVICCLASGQAAIYLGKSWCIIEERWPEYTTMQSDPYSIIGLKAFGREAQVVTTIGVFVQCYGSAVVILNICADLIFLLVKDIDWFPKISNCEWVILIGLIAIPFMWLPTPAEITFVAYTAFCCTVVSCGLLMAIYFQVLSEDREVKPPSPVQPKTFFPAMATVAFAFGGAAAFPTFQNFMEDKRKFPQAVVVAFTLLIILFVPISVTGFVTYGGDLKPNILFNLPNSIMKTGIIVMMAVHVFAALLILINPINISIEKSVGVSGQGISFMRCLVRTLVGMSLIIAILSVPKFEMILNLVGASSVSATSFIFPTLYYWGLTRQTNDMWVDRRLNNWSKLLCLSICAFGVIGGGVATYYAVEHITEFVKPCYV